MSSNVKTAKYFIQTTSSGSEKPQIVFFDERGNETTAQSRLLETHFDKLLTVFNGLPKAVRRSSGGLIIVHPTQLVHLHTEQGAEEIRVKVLFKELERNAQHQIISKKIILSSKTVPLSEIQEGFSHDAIHTHNFVVDMGLGIIPVHVLSFYPDSQGHTWALFVRHDEIQKALLESRPSQIMVYEVPLDLLRRIEPFSDSNEKDFQWAKNHVHKLLDRGEKIVPEILSIGPSAEVPAGLSFTELEQCLLSSTQKSLVLDGQTYFLSNAEGTEQEPLLLLNENPD